MPEGGGMEGITVEPCPIMANLLAISSRFAMAALRSFVCGGTNGAGGAAMGNGDMGLGLDPAPGMWAGVGIDCVWPEFCMRFVGA